MNKEKDKDQDFILETLNSIKEDLVLARKILSNSEKTKYKPMNNVRFITPHIIVEFEEFKNNNQKSVIELLQKYKIWSHEICATIIANKGNLKNQKLLKHLNDSLLVCESLDYSFRIVFDKK